VQRDCWDDAACPGERNKAAFHSDDFIPLMERDQFRILDGDTELVPNVWARSTGGHARGHQIVTVESGSEKLAFLGDLVPTSHHLPLPYISATDYAPDETLEQKRQLLDFVAQDGWLAIFSHDDEHRAGYLNRRNGDLLFRSVEL
jgi:glyoxylase-like metal-dependent hydrolase (beta-lactamase superfamily II)